MKKNIFIIIVCVFTMLLCGCKCSKCSKVTTESIKKNYQYFDATLNINNESYQIIKEKNGYLYRNLKNDSIIYYNLANKTYYEINEENKTKTVLNNKYNLDNYIKNVYYILSYYVEKESKTNYEIEQTSYLGYDINILKKDSTNLIEEIYVVKKLNICLGFSIKNDEKSINAKIENINFEGIDLSKYDTYSIIENSSEQIKKHFDKYSIEVSLDGNEYKLISSTEGYYYENIDENICLYYDLNTDSYYTINHKSKTKILITGNYTMSAYIDKTFYILLYHLDKKILTDYNKELGKFLGRDITKYSINGTYQETIIVDNKTNCCLSFELKSSDKLIFGKVNNIKFEDTDLTYLNEYQILKKTEELNFKTKDEIINQLSNYSIVLKQEENDVKIIKNNSGFVYLIDKDDNVSGVLFDSINNIWYDISVNSKEKAVSTKEYNINDFEEKLFDLLTNHTEYVDDKFYMLENQKFLERDVTIYIRSFAIKDTLYKQEFVVDNITGACLKQDINVNGVSTYFYVDEFSLNGSIDEYLEYFDIYYSWPKDHKYLDNIQEIEYGTLVKGFEDEDGLNLYYKDINNSFFNQILKDIKASGFINEVEEDYALGDNQLYIYYIYDALDNNGLNVRLEFDGYSKTLLIIISETIR